MKKKVLVVEDEQPLNEVYSHILKQAGYNVKSAFSGVEALESTADFEPDLILLDLRMPQMSGIEFLKAYRLTDEHPKVQVIVFSNLDVQKEIDEAYALGAQRYMLKAWASPKDLLKLVSDTLKA